MTTQTLLTEWLETYERNTLSQEPIRAIKG